MEVKQKTNLGDFREGEIRTISSIYVHVCGSYSKEDTMAENRCQWELRMLGTLCCLKILTLWFII